eukprot:TRINITY_DN2480_c0_g1_i1.p1 TRINITY_DN2480_c0_g1~~TRINITY_DN2480_c0_g1_i1.p1  ORF type:complete len:478 (+),score=89.10 TRINITY_DN2480_c0_g1_i1:246-1679(+)
MTHIPPELLTPRSRRPPPKLIQTEPAPGPRHAHTFEHAHGSSEVPAIQMSERIVNVNRDGLASIVRLNFLAGHTRGHTACNDEDGLVSCTAMEDLQREFEQRREPMADDLVQLANVVRHYLFRVYRDGRFRHPSHDVPALADRLIQLCSRCADVLDQEPRLLRLEAPVYVLGDIHGNFEDLSFFVRQLTTFGEFDFTTHSVLFLGDYVDRGLWGVECAALLLAMKCLAPTKVFLLRGNHEFPEINGAVNSYGQSSFLSQCSRLFGAERGFKVWAAFNDAFKHLPLAAVVDKTIFCVHGGIPRRSTSPGEDRRIESLEDSAFPRFAYTTCSKADRDQRRLLMTDLMWSDPVEWGAGETDADGFGESDRGPSLSVFGDKAIDDFFRRYKFSMMVRAHEHKKVGLRLSNHRRVLTVFSSSAYCGTDFGASALFIDRNTIRIVTKEVTRAAQIAYAHFEADDDDDQSVAGASTSASSTGGR